MTWNELNLKCDDMLPDCIGPAWEEWMDDGMGDEEVYECKGLDMIISTLFDVATDEPKNAERWLSIAHELKEQYC